MTDYSSSSAAGASKGDGSTTVVGLDGRLSGKDKEVLCGVMCPCARIGVATREDKRGRSRTLRQACVAQRLDAMNADARRKYGAPTEYLPEVSYDMSPTPPAPPVPIMDEASPLRPDSLVDWIRDNWPGSMKGYRDGKKAGLDQTRRPDVVIVRDPALPPEQSNIKTVVEMKFEDSYGDRQKEAYVRIAGSNKKVATLRPADCGCRDDEPDEKPVQSTQTQSEIESIFGVGPAGPNRMLPAPIPHLPPGVPGFALP
ncbi:VRR-NUC domain-containing protein [Burkholderia multivorans]|uniref:VRR-NUC domain-containing protein n=1 Tax=Burkholderia multivorans TaxID=87883 RepID=UPI00209CBCA5|nr:VRR-NUC domain-containing protein [Burkholderia multivorans]MCO8591031.1 VRR-NUC domain-containing protein [Burkholderia multivorans]MCO8633055.1 VRR-NUC domain-containing protein [Burkholderia multivorans]